MKPLGSVAILNLLQIASRALQISEAALRADPEAEQLETRMALAKAVEGLKQTSEFLSKQIPNGGDQS